MEKRALNNTKRRIVNALARYENTDVYLTEVRDEYSDRIASIYFVPGTNSYCMKPKKYVAKHNKYEEGKIMHADSIDGILKYVAAFVGPKGQ